MEPLKGPGDRKKYDMVKKYIYIIFLLIFSSNTTSGHYPLSLYRIEQHEHSPKYLLLCSAEKVKCLRDTEGLLMSSHFYLVLFQVGIQRIVFVRSE